MHTSPKTIRERLFSYFSQQVSAQGSNEIIIPFNRQQLADYLNLDRSALSKELGKMRDDGLIEFHKNTFVIKTAAPGSSPEAAMLTLTVNLVGYPSHMHRK